VIGVTMSRIKAKGLVVFVVLSIFIGCGKREERLLEPGEGEAIKGV